MIDTITYAEALYDALDKKDYGPTVMLLQVLTELTQTNTMILSHLDKAQFNQLLASLSTYPTATTNLLTVLHQESAIRYIPKINAAFRRVMNHHNHPIIDVATAEPSFDTMQLISYFGNEAVIMHTYSPELIAGIRITTAEDSYEYTVDQQLQQLQHRLQMP